MTSSNDGTDLRQTLRARPIDGALSLAGHDTRATPGVASKADGKSELREELSDRLFDRHEMLFAESDRSVLLVLQGTDCSGKNGTIKHVAIHMNPAGVDITEFGPPTEDEQKQHFLERIEEAVPGPGQLGVFARSHYEDVLVPSARGTLDQAEIDDRIDEIISFEKRLVDGGTTVVKCLLDLSFDEQRERFLRRLRRDDKRWKFDVGDVETRRHWHEFQAAYGSVVGRTDLDVAPWYVIPSDRKWYRNWAIARILLETFDDMGLAYPQPDLDIEGLVQRLEAPN